LRRGAAKFRDGVLIGNRVGDIVDIKVNGAVQKG
jgi:ribosomal protein L21E